MQEPERSRFAAVWVGLFLLVMVGNALGRETRTIPVSAALGGASGYLLSLIAWVIADVLRTGSLGAFSHLDSPTNLVAVLGLNVVNGAWITALVGFVVVEALRHRFVTVP